MSPTVDVAPPAACVVRLTGGDAAWASAVADLRLRAGDLACRSIDVHVDAQGAIVVLLSPDGRNAVRRATTPAELTLTVDALLVTVPDAALSTPLAPSPRAEVTATKTAPAAVAEPPPHYGAVVALYGGGRVGWPGRFVSPLLGVSAMLSLRDWQLGVFGDWEANYTSTVNPLPSRFQMDTVLAGVAVARRVPETGLFVESRLAVAVVTQEGDESTEEGGDGAELRAGLGLRFTVPRDSAVRARFTVGIDVSPSRILHSRPLSPTLPPPPTWGLSLTVGLEGDAS